MSLPAIKGEELRAWAEHTSNAWHDLVAAHPEILAFPCDIRETRTVGELLQHIIAAEVRYAERLAGQPETPYEAITYGSAESIYQTHHRAMNILSGLSDHEDSWWEDWIEFQTRKGGPMRVTRRTVFIHLFMHSIRHYAQLATIVRQNGIAATWPMDYIVMQLRK